MLASKMASASGNAATAGLLDLLNNYLATFGKLSVADISVNESAGTVSVTVSLSATSTNTITVAYATSNGTATAGADYTAVNGILTFEPIHNRKISGDKIHIINTPMVNNTHIFIKFLIDFLIQL